MLQDLPLIDCQDKRLKDLRHRFSILNHWFIRMENVGVRCVHPDHQILRQQVRIQRCLEIKLGIFRNNFLIAEIINSVITKGIRSLDPYFISCSVMITEIRLRTSPRINPSSRLAHPTFITALVTLKKVFKASPCYRFHDKAPIGRIIYF